MEKLLEQGKLRSDLFHRLNVLALNVPPLRERVEDIQPLTDGFLQEISTQLKIPMPQYDADFFELFERGSLGKVMCESFTMSCIVPVP